MIPGNDDAIRAVRLLSAKIADAVIEGRQGEQFSEAETDNDTEEVNLEMPIEIGTELAEEELPTEEEPGLEEE